MWRWNHALYLLDCWFFVLAVLLYCLLCCILGSIGVTAYVVSGSQDAVNLLRMRPKRKIPLSVGGMETKVYELFVLPPKASTSGAAGILEKV
jgi:hypothetical protein